MPLSGGNFILNKKITIRVPYGIFNVVQSPFYPIMMYFCTLKPNWALIWFKIVHLNTCYGSTYSN